MMLPFPVLLAEFGSVEKIVITVLATAGGFLIGYLATGVLINIVSKFSLGKPPSERLARFTKLLGGALAAIAVYLVLSGSGGLGFGGSGGGNSQRKDEGKNEGKATTQDTIKEPKPPEIKKTKDEELRGAPLSVYVLGVDATNGHFFRFEDEKEPLTEDEIIQRIDRLEKDGKLKNKQVRMKAGTENMSVPQYAKIYSRLRAEFEPRGFEIIPLKSESRP